jgi:hypothetical protein
MSHVLPTQLSHIRTRDACHVMSCHVPQININTFPLPSKFVVVISLLSEQLLQRDRTRINRGFTTSDDVYNLFPSKMIMTDAKGEARISATLLRRYI